MQDLVGPKVLVDRELLELDDETPWDIVYQTAVEMALTLQSPVAIQMIAGQPCCYQYDEEVAPFMADLDADFAVFDVALPQQPMCAA
ncbi:MAG: hypothetical protein HY319_21810 [Armatimonadetes bacterium]|nr:hypothetical protein [Armatimonadota bacterium]